ncbi:SDR family NAD(P)-dependent oxidoreductase [Pseudonocardia sichuanensis]
MPPAVRHPDGRTAVVIGAGTGIGLATAERPAAEGAHVFLTGRRQAELDAAVASIGSAATGVVGDAAREARAVAARQGAVRDGRTATRRGRAWACSCSQRLECAAAAPSCVGVHHRGPIWKRIRCPTSGTPRMLRAPPGTTARPRRRRPTRPREHRARASRRRPCWPRWAAPRVSSTRRSR